MSGAAATAPQTRGAWIASKARQALADTVAAEAEAAAFRAGDAAEQARLALQRRGFAVFRAHVTGGPADRWRVGGRAELLTDAELIALAERRAPPITRAENGATTAANAAAPPAPGNVRESKMFNDETALLTGAQRLERGGLTAEQLRETLSALRDTFVEDGVSKNEAAQRLGQAVGLGRSTVYNVMGGHAKPGNSVIDAFYDEAEDGRLVLKAQWLDRLDPPEAEAAIETPESTRAAWRSSCRVPLHDQGDANGFPPIGDDPDEIETPESTAPASPVDSIAPASAAAADVTGDAVARAGTANPPPCPPATEPSPEMVAQLRARFGVAGRAALEPAPTDIVRADLEDRLAACRARRAEAEAQLLAADADVRALVRVLELYGVHQRAEVAA